MSQDEWALFDLAVKSVPRVYVWGPPCLGKSYAGQRALKIDDQDLVRQVTLNEDIVVQELLGHFVPRGNVFEWHDGPVTTSFRKGEGLVINELARAGGAVKDMFLGILDGHEVASMSLPTGERLKPNLGFRVVATANNPPTDLDEALQDRFDVVVHVTTPHPGVVLKLNSEMKGLGDFIRNSYLDPKRAISPRRALVFVEFMKKRVPLETSALMAFGERYADIIALFKAKTICVSS